MLANWITELSPTQFVPMMAMSIPIVAIISYFVSHTFIERSKIDLKTRMVEQGRSAEEIERVLKAQTSEAADD